jgi:hypothetical protein
VGRTAKETCPTGPAGLGGASCVCAGARAGVAGCYAKNPGGQVPLGAPMGQFETCTEQGPHGFFVLFSCSTGPTP